MDAGRVMDALVATRVMGLQEGQEFGLKARHEWHGVDDPESIGGTYQCQRCYQGSGWIDKSQLEAGPCEVDPDPYSTSIAVAWDVVAHALSVEVAYDSNPPRWRCYIDLGHARFATRQDQPSAPLAICRAALAAVGAEVPD